MRRWMCLALLGGGFILSPLSSSEAVKAVVSPRIRFAVCGCILEAARLGVLDWRQAQRWHNQFYSWMDGESS